MKMKNTNPLVKTSYLTAMLLAILSVMASCVSYTPLNTAVEPTKPAVEGVLPGVFTVAEGRQVRFSQGNLQYQASTNTWRFAEHQWDIIGEKNSNISPSYDGWIDLFGWATSGYHDTLDDLNINYQPWSNSTKPLTKSKNNNLIRVSGYGPYNNMSTTHLTGSCANYDWGVYNAISNGGNQAGLWRTLLFDEWIYLINHRVTHSGVRFVKAQVNNVNGMILLPDDWDVSYFKLNRINKFWGSYKYNKITSKEWVKLETHGAVFLPAAGYRKKTSVKHLGSRGGYWSASPGAYNTAWSFMYYGRGLLFSDNLSPCIGRSLRLVTSVSNEE